MLVIIGLILVGLAAWELGEFDAFLCCMLAPAAFAALAIFLMGG